MQVQDEEKAKWVRRHADRLDMQMKGRESDVGKLIELLCSGKPSSTVSKIEPSIKHLVINNRHSGCIRSMASTSS